MDVSQWEYYGEGGKHALFSFHSCSDDNDNHDEAQQDQRYYGKLLRIQKRDIKRAAALIANHGKSKDCNVQTQYQHERELQQAVPSPTEKDPTFFIRHVVAPYMTPLFVDIPEVVQLDCSFVHDLHSKAIASGKIPQARRNDWIVDDDSDSSSLLTTSQVPFMATLVLDYRHFQWQYIPHNSPPHQIHQTSQSSTQTISIELKPKAGYIAFSPLVDPLYRNIKYCQSRFRSLQELQEQGHWTKGWSENREIKRDTFCKSLYDPIDLFSIVDNDGGNRGDQSSKTLKYAISKLFQNPQNNLRIWYQDEPLVNLDVIVCNIQSKWHNQMVENDEFSMSVLENLFSPSISADVDRKLKFDTYEDVSAPKELENVLEEIVFQILTSQQGKQLLTKILSWQKLDIIDVDGAVLIYERLVDLCHGSHQEAQHLLDDIQLNDLKGEACDDSNNSDKTALPMLEASPFNNNCLLEEKSQAIIRFCEEVQKFHHTLVNAGHNLPPGNVMDESNKKLYGIINELSLEECRFLLQNWLLSLMVCDVSIFISLKIIQEECQLTMAHNEAMQPIHINYKEKQRYFVAQLRLIDCDQKPAKKFKKRKEKEKAFRFLTSNTKSKEKDN